MILAQLGQKPRAPRDVVPFRFRAIDGEYLLTSEWGDWVFVSQDELRTLARGDLEPGTPLHARLASRNFIRSSLDQAAIADRLRHRKRFLDYGLKRTDLERL